jgi:hypothetical protein
MPVAMSSMAWRYIEANVTGVICEEWCIDVVTQARDADYGATGIDQPAMSARNLAVTKIQSKFLVQ